ncbi:MAG: alpha-L-fucosidase [bacterium]|nr:alpha-L-fucosidase [bacterium]
MMQQETNPLVLAKLEQWQDARFGLMMHWGTYSQWGACESWPICSEPWITRTMDNYEEYKRAYENLKTTFNPVDFNPEQWADWAAAAGMKYVVFTTKHHDGFCMFDTKQTDYKVTDPACPFSTNPRANITKELFDAFRKRDIMIGAYFSKPDWHSPNYWSPYWATPDRNTNYDPDDNPELWQKFKEFTYRQIEELVRDYGPIDILWLDGCWVQPVSAIEKLAHNVEKCKNQDLAMDDLAALARSYQPDLIIVDRWVKGRQENYLTPEGNIPAEPLPQPWETCMPMAGAWSYYPDDNYKSPRKLIHQLAEVVSKGGNFLLNIGVDGNGNYPPEAVLRLQAIASWMNINREAIHNTRAIAPYIDGKCRLTQGKDGSIYAIYLADEGESTPPTHILLTSQNPAVTACVHLLGCEELISWQSVGNGILITIPEKFIAATPCNEAWVIKISHIKN